MKKKIRTALIDVGGGMRGMYAAGILDRMLDDEVYTDLCIGVSAGSGNLASYCARQKGRNYAFYGEYPARAEYMSLQNYLKKRTYFDFDYIYSDLTNRGGENPLDYQAMDHSQSRLLVVATNTLTGRPAYFDEKWVQQDSYEIFKGSCAIPLICHPYRIGGIEFCDGTISDPVPVAKAFEMGAEKVILILSAPLEEDKGSRSMELMQSMLLHSRYGKRYPAVARAFLKRTEVYNESVRLAKELERQGKLLIIYPDDCCGVSSLSRDIRKLQQLYDKGYADGAKAKAFLHKSDAQESDWSVCANHKSVSASQPDPALLS